jgi:hypothetical protein
MREHRMTMIARRALFRRDCGTCYWIVVQINSP